MINANELIRRGEIIVPFLMYMGPVEEWFKAQYDIKYQDFRILCYIYGLDYHHNFFTKNDFDAITSAYSWNIKRMKEFEEKGFVKKFYETNRISGDVDKWKFTSKGKNIMAQMYRILLGYDKIPSSYRWSKVMKNKYKAKTIEHANEQIRKINNVSKNTNNEGHAEWS